MKLKELCKHKNIVNRTGSELSEAWRALENAKDRDRFAKAVIAAGRHDLIAEYFEELDTPQKKELHKDKTWTRNWLSSTENVITYTSWFFTH